MNRLEYRVLYETLGELFGNDLSHSVNRWDITSVPRGNYYLGERWHDRVAVHFKTKEDMVFFKLSVDQDHSNG